MANPADQCLDEALKRRWVQEIERRARVALAGSPGLSWTETRDQVLSRVAKP